MPNRLGAAAYGGFLVSQPPGGTQPKEPRRCSAVTTLINRSGAEVRTRVPLSLPVLGLEDLARQSPGSSGIWASTPSIRSSSESRQAP